MRGIHAIGIGVLLLAAMTACDSGTTNPTPAAVIHYVGNSSCPTAGTQAYDPAPPGTNGAPVGQAIDEMPHSHVQVGTKVQYNHDPPTSGCHYSVAGTATQLAAPIPPGVYNQQIDAEYWMHNLEHGYVAVLYNCPSGCAADFAKLQAWQKSLAPETPFTYAKVIVLPWTTMSDKFACVSWDWYLGMQSLDINQVQAFYDNHKGHSPEGPNVG